MNRKLFTFCFFMTFSFQGFAYTQDNIDPEKLMIPIWEFSLPSGQSAFTPVSPGDINSDGVNDLCFGVLGYGVPVQTAVYAISGLNGKILWEYQLLTPSKMKGTGRLAVHDDFDGDGIQELIVALYPEVPPFNNYCEVHVINGRTKAVIWKVVVPQEWSGVQIKRVPDVTGDGISDVVVGGGNTSAVWMLDGTSGTLLWETDVNIPFSSFAHYVGDMHSLKIKGGFSGDINGDIVPDVVIGTWSLFVPPSEYGSVIALSGRTGDIIWRHDGRFGSSVQVQNYGPRPPRIISTYTNEGSIPSDSIIHVIDCLNGKIIKKTPPSTYDFYTTILPLLDIDLDQLEEMIMKKFVGSGTVIPKSILGVYNGSSGATLWEVPESKYGKPHRFTTIEDINSDNVPEVVATFTKDFFSYRTIILDGKGGNELRCTHPDSKFNNRTVNTYDIDNDGRKDDVVISGEGGVIRFDD